MSTTAFEQMLASVRPSERQLAWQEMEFYGFIHFGINTMTDREWGEGHEDPALFDPSDLDADQWVAAIKSAGMTGVVLTCKHHDGFALWPSDVTDHSVALSPWRGGKGDVVAEVADAARRHGLKFGVYLSPWDRTEASYGSGTGYDDFYVAQLTELLTRYGPVFSVWLDGANGEGPNGRRQVYDWERYYAVVRELQPDAVINVCGPDVRWCGNEAGETRPDEWSVVPRALQDAERTASRSQQADDGSFARLVRSDDRDLGSRAALAGHEDDLVWYPAEVNTSIRPGWFHHPAEDGHVRSVDELFTIYLRSVGGNSCFLLNIPPAADGRLREADVDTLKGLGQRIADFRSRRIEADATVTSGTPGDVATAWPGKARTSWRPDDTDARPTVTLAFAGARPVEAVVLGEDITQGQRIEHVVVRGGRNGDWTTLAEANAVGYQRILTFPPAEVDTVVVEIIQSRDTPVVSRVAAIGTSL
ncbi:alpha-L-fucosidase [Streptomyces brasiliensis]|uniref:alpha-L-fucosidase n=1 Tax=Streptomyces brasiliensis TaxID=1954 RepID=A0A917LAB7_9ACTN|nr:alpha-L-fucosidase [Streptomyces brasiliensis]GGJ48548.1 alpha-L-fucosidase [Streptomyces brasiliensis]